MQEARTSTKEGLSHQAKSNTQIIADDKLSNESVPRSASYRQISIIAFPNRSDQCLSSSRSMVNLSADKDHYSTRNDARRKRVSSLDNLREGIQKQSHDLAAVNQFCDLNKTSVERPKLQDDVSSSPEKKSTCEPKENAKRKLSESDSNEDLPSFQRQIQHDDKEIDQLSQQTASQLEITEKIDKSDESENVKRHKTHKDIEMSGFCYMCEGSVKWQVCSGFREEANDRYYYKCDHCSWFDEQDFPNKGYFCLF